MMKYFICILMFVHGAIHLLGFIKAFHIATVEQLTNPISKTTGLFWFASFALFTVSVIAYGTKADWWYLVAIISVMVSTILIITSWSDAKYGMIPNLLILIVSFIGFTTYNFNQNFKNENKEQRSKNIDQRTKNQEPRSKN